ncbi:pyrroloquinoline quinone biosynthesis protein B [Amycolatopsis arida]|uniref:Coenzyme PQQ synthesis protein B n=1 Tax=Amycolatopsis arida TaxID=587909 RepID=A0A1I5LDP8_9PSEU|nr:pyrroloquinoline quinone biosynthesis protein PqqB [Amycolatopsis arida]TDX93682.1 pyrroloquinoline quinone biosynthesis protein B [Amycolatopsis arida]SFO95347.1 pyrroloquinoline quinone biosynthesis protein B [Amycolatopsis arida]
MRVVLLGTAAGGGVPQWNCACPRCRSVRRSGASRTQDCLAVSADGAHWYLLNASPDLRAQLLDTPALAPGPGPRETPLRGALLTDAELDHVLGLLLLREGDGLPVWAPEAVTHALRDGFAVRDVLARHGAWEWRPVAGSVDVGGLRVTTVPVSGKRPRYAASSDVDGPWVVAYRIADPVTGGVLVYAPCLASWPDGFDDVVAGADCVLLDGTFHGGDEMAAAAGDSRGQRSMGHLPIAGAGGSMARRADFPDVRWMYTHLNNTNPVLDPHSPEHRAVLDAGAELPEDGTELVL